MDPQWDQLVDEIATAEEEDVLEVLNFAPRVPPAVQAAIAQPRRLGYSPQMSVSDAMHTKPAQPHETDALARGRDEPTFERAVSRAIAVKIAPAIPMAPDFSPIIIVPSSAVAIVQMGNVKDFIELGTYRECDPAAPRENQIFVKPTMFPAVEAYRVAFRTFRIVDNPRQVEDWRHVCACFVTGHLWQFDGWFEGNKTKADPANLFDGVRGFFPYFEEDKLPPILKQWQVVPLLMTKKETKAHSAVRVAATFWEELFKFLDSHPFFRSFTLSHSMPVN